MVIIDMVCIYVGGLITGVVISIFISKLKIVNQTIKAQKELIEHQTLVAHKAVDAQFLKYLIIVYNCKTVEELIVEYKKYSNDVWTKELHDLCDSIMPKF